MIVGITGYARHGKDTIADVLFALMPHARKLSLAYPMKEACKLIFDWTDAHVYGELKDVIDPKWGVSPRQALTTIGTEWGQYCLCKFPAFKETTGRKLWIKSLLTNVDDNFGNYIIPDVRFHHEVEEILKQPNSYIIKVRRKEYSIDTSHESEQDISCIYHNLLIYNDSTVESLQERTREIHKHILSKMENKSL